MKKIIFYFLFLIAISTTKATHNRSGEILYKRVAPFTNVVGGVTVQVYTYSITIVRYTDDGSGIADRCVDTVSFGDGNKGVAPRVNGSASSCGCGMLNGTPITCGTILSNDPNYIVKQNVYSIIHTYPGPGSYLIRSIDPNRSPGIHNIPSSVAVPFYLEAYLIINSFTGSNSSPLLMNPPIKQGTVGVCFYHDPGAIDSDGDSLSYEITTCRTIGGQTTPGYFYPELGFNGSYTIHPVTGVLAWCVPQFLDKYCLAFIVKEWRKNTSGVPQMIGYVLRDMEVLISHGVVGIGEINSLDNILAYPNPFNKNIEIDLGVNSYNQLKSSIYSVEGKLIHTSTNTNVSGKLDFLLNDLKPGIYTLILETEKGKHFKKIVKD